eukprot:TRINITY_DN1324_c0_g2_i1.p1 TRINITY_DN1324_c0_g2~~TRINITY_DN1324_c0_g2_i1.p1  ORF type:complete len:790 (+),score=188.92 TRINITY_DN1324_c0_g2_i1:842-3211(+)
MSFRRKRGGSPYLVDSQLLPRVQTYLDENPETVWTEDIVDWLQNTFTVYRRKPQSALKISVEKALSIIKLAEVNEDDEDKEKAAAPSATAKTTKKSEDTSESEDNNLEVEGNPVKLVEHKDTNMMNNAIREAYKKTQKPSNTKTASSNSGQEEPKKRVKKANGPQSVESTLKERLKNKTAGSSATFRPSIRYHHLGGIETILKDIHEIVERPMLHPEVYSHLGVAPPRGILLHGPPGCGKTMLAHAIAGELGVPFLKVSAPEIISGVSGESEAKLRKIFDEAAASSPSLVFIDEIDAITPKRQDASREMERRIVSQLLSCMDDLTPEKTGGNPVVIIGATSRPDSLDSALRREGRFDKEICLGVPDEAARIRILKVMTKGLKLDGNFDFSSIAKRTPGYVGADLQSLIKEAAKFAINRIFSKLENTELHKAQKAEQEKLREDTNITLDRKMPPRFSTEQMGDLAIVMEDFEMAIPEVQPSAKREGFATIPDVTWENVGALSDVRKQLEMALLAPINHREKFEKIGLKATSSGVLLYGPPGCGKTLLAKAMANECQLNFISVKGPELLNKYVGESERAVRQTFTRARASAPCIIFFDEIDALCPRRDLKETQSGQRVVTQMLTEMDGLDARKEIFVIAASNRPDMIDPALLRPGRLDRLIYIPLPDPQARISILVTCARKVPLDEGVKIEELALSDSCNGYSGADLENLVKTAQEECLRAHLEEGTPLIVTKKHFEVAQSKILPSVTKQDEKRYNALNHFFVASRTRPIDTPKDNPTDNETPNSQNKPSE